VCFMELHFSKIQGCGNSFVIVQEGDLPEYALRSSGGWSEDRKKRLAVEVCHGGRGLGADGFFVVAPHWNSAEEGLDPRMTPLDGLLVDMRNPDGGPMGMCGNGVRCVVRAAYRWGWLLPSPVPVSIGKLSVDCVTADEGRSVQVAMGAPRFEPASVPLRSETPLRGDDLFLGGRQRRVWALSMGNPHCIVLDEGEDLRVIGPTIENDPLFPERTNLELVTPVSRRRISVRVWERGAGITQACGTGACAAAVVSIEQGICDSPVTVCMPGGELTVSWDRHDGVYLTGPAQEIASGLMTIPGFD
jgi:diaminopimelate epimerase